MNTDWFRSEYAISRLPSPLICASVSESTAGKSFSSSPSAAFLTIPAPSLPCFTRSSTSRLSVWSPMRTTFTSTDFASDGLSFGVTVMTAVPSAMPVILPVPSTFTTDSSLEVYSRSPCVVLAGVSVTERDADEPGVSSETWPISMPCSGMSSSTNATLSM